MAQTLSLHEANQAVPGWRALATGLHITVATDDFAGALALVDRIGAIAEEQQHHPTSTFGGAASTSSPPATTSAASPTATSGSRPP